jgi:hypothetical protein
MNATLCRKPTFDSIFADPNLAALANLCATDRAVRRFTVGMIQRHTKRRYALGPYGVKMRAQFWAQANPDADAARVAAIEQAGDLLHDLYAAHNAGNLRGVILESLLCDRLRQVYDPSAVVDNAFVETEKEGVVYRTCDSPSSWDGSVDAAAWDQARQVGECHDCKVRASEVDVGVIQELEANLPSPEFLMGVVTTNSYLEAAAELEAKGYKPSLRSKIIAMEKLWDFTPLWRQRLTA